MEVFVLEYSDYDDFYVVGVYSSEEKAEAGIDEEIKSKPECKLKKEQFFINSFPVK